MGAYAFKTDDGRATPSHRAGERLVLHEDGGYEILSGESKGAASAISGRWAFVDYDPPQVDLGQFTRYEIKIDDHTVRLVVDSDVDARYEKSITDHL